ncbi:Nitrilase family, member 2 [Seminavis robusta]|uniref:Nitrilase family, member 2 n=1 Tax=Seminavis robusta TaxID=568900 RepID=A0A9N8DUP4_9STRA|nr:Nitrilase family, member 2 [Seminavis robusta]|eukprot:Sro289_g109160.1 Nitrilase family, member 2 (265) ;mRNA; f:60210-61341
MKTAESGIAKLARNVRPSICYGSSRELGAQFVPGPMDVICSRGKQALAHEGNKAFRRIIDSHIDAYKKATSKMDKSVIVTAIIDKIRNASPDGGFIRQLDGQWIEVGDHVAREKVGQTLRDMISHKYKSSTKSKKVRRKELQAKQNDDIDDFMRANCPDITERVKQLTLTAKTEEELQAAFNQANCELLTALKKAKGGGSQELAAFANAMETSDPSELKLKLPGRDSPQSCCASVASDATPAAAPGPMSLDDAVDDYHLRYSKL